MTILSRLVSTRVILIVAAFATVSSVQAGLLGTSVNGKLEFSGNPNNYFDPVNGFVPAGVGNVASTTVLIGAGVEFGFFDGANRDTADFSDFGLLVTDIASTTFGAGAWRMTFINPAFIGLTLTEVSDTFPNAGGVAASLSGNTLILNFAGSTAAPATWTAQYSFAASSVPDGGTSVCLLALALASLAGIRRLRLNT
jgi:hypothetical protein